MTLRVMLIDDERPARARLRQLLGDIAGQLATEVVAEAGNGVEALEWLSQADAEADVALVDIRMPGMDGLQLALHLARLPSPPAVIFVTAYDQYAVKAFELSAVDYLLKPVRAPRLLDALSKVKPGPLAAATLQALAPEGRRHLRSTQRGRVHLIPVEDLVYLKAEQKYVVARTREGEFLLDDSLAQLETELGERMVRVHRNCLVAKAAIAGCERQGEAGQEGEPSWALILHGVAERIPTSRRQWPHVKVLIRH